MEQAENPLLHIGIEVDQHVAATDQVELRERRIADHILFGEHHQIAHLLADAIGVLPMDEIAAEQIARDVGGNALRVNARPGERQGVVIDVRRENVNVENFVLLLGVAQDQHRQRVGFFARRAAGRPDADRSFGTMRGDQRDDDRFLEGLPGLGLAEKAGDADQHVLEQRADLALALPEIFDVLLHIRDVIEPHPPLDAADQRSRACSRRNRISPATAESR